MQKVDILSLSPAELEAAIAAKGWPRYRAGQLYGALHRTMAAGLDEVTTLSKSDRAALGEEYFVPPVTEVRTLVSAVDGTIKYLFRLHDGQLVESVLMKYRHGNSVCLSTQAGCRMGCAFCASTIAGWARNLSCGEILGQIYAIARLSGEKISNIVLMGIGEPLDNYDNVIAFLRRINSPEGQNIGYRHISLSTCGLADAIDRLSGEDIPLTLSVSLHAPTDEMRSQMMPINRRYPLQRLLQSCKNYADKGNRRISYEYALIQGVNDSPACAEKLCELLEGYQALSHFNLIPVNEVAERNFSPAYRSQIKAFQAILEKQGFSATVRRTLGADINAACGQLRAERLN